MKVVADSPLASARVYIVSFPGNLLTKLLVAITYYDISQDPSEDEPLPASDAAINAQQDKYTGQAPEVTANAGILEKDISDEDDDE
jgi:hypothetical protein